MKNIALKLIILGLLLFMHCDLLLADTLILKSGKVVECEILERNKDYVKVAYGDRPLYYEWKYIQEIKEEPIKPAEGVIEQPILAKERSKAVAVILTNTSKGFSPLKVDFNGLKSFSRAGKIVSYRWDFGDGDTSSSPKAKNTYLSATYEPRIYTVKLTVRDEKGNIGSASTLITVTNK